MRNKKNMQCQYLLTHEVPTDFFPEKRADYRLSRKSLRDLTGLECLEIVDHLHMKDDPTIKVSLSHTKDLGCAAISKDPKVASIGVDVEWSDRTYRSGIEKYFLLESDDKDLELIELWACKEAAYKAYSPLYKGQKTLVIKDFTIQDHKIIFQDEIIGDIWVEKIEYLGRELILSQGIIYHC